MGPGIHPRQRLVPPRRVHEPHLWVCTSSGVSVSLGGCLGDAADVLHLCVRRGEGAWVFVLHRGFPQSEHSDGSCSSPAQELLPPRVRGLLWSALLAQRELNGQEVGVWEPSAVEWGEEGMGKSVFLCLCVSVCVCKASKQCSDNPGVTPDDSAVPGTTCGYSE